MVRWCLCLWLCSCNVRLVVMVRDLATGYSGSGLQRGGDSRDREWLVAVIGSAAVD
jgi:hypothetical protein